MILVFTLSCDAASVCIKETCVDVQIVSTKKEMMRGLQGRTELASNQGMLFDFKKEGLYSFWMKDMKISIDMIWLDADGKIITIASSRKPCQSEPCEAYFSTDKARYVLEVVDGFAVNNQLTVGQALQFKDIN
jgi:uncharacterized membrane protein (UPF0127 family)